MSADDGASINGAAAKTLVDGGDHFYDDFHEEIPEEDYPLLDIDDTLTAYVEDEGTEEEVGRIHLGSVDKDNNNNEGWWGSKAAIINALRMGPGLQVHSPVAILSVLTGMFFAMVLSAILILIPMARLMEDNICHRYYGKPAEEPIEERLCKVDQVQAEMAWLGGNYVVIEAAVGLIVSFPWGILSDRIGRKPIFRMSFMSVVLSVCWSLFVLSHSETLPIKLCLLSPLFTIFGGGANVSVAVIHSIIADITTERASAFIWTSMGAVAGAVTGPALAALLMGSFSPWVPIMISGLILLPIFLATCFLPETRPATIQITADAPSQAQEEGRGNGIADDMESGGKGQQQQSLRSAFRTHLAHSMGNLRSSVGMLRSVSLLLVMPTFAVLSPNQTAQGATLGQTISKRFGWTLGQTGYFFSARGLLTVAALALLPLLSRPSSFGKDLRLTRVSLLLLVVGNALTGFENIGVLAAGQLAATLAVGSGSLAKSVAAGLVRPDETGRLYTLTGMAETAGSLVGGPSMAWAFEKGVKAGGIWMGLPFWYTAVLCAMALTTLCFIRPLRLATGEEGGSGQAAAEDEAPLID